MVKCTACEGPMQSPAFCDHCRSLFPADQLSHFELLGLQPVYDLPANTLRQRYLSVSRGVHPDRHTEEGGTLSVRLSSQLNEAFRVLADPILRAEYLLELAGGASAASQREVPPEVLADTLELREELQEARMEDDADRLAECRGRVQAAYDERHTAIAALARRLPGDEALWRELRTALNGIKYYQRLRSEF
jgi:molecular chaperone HscB